MFQFTPVQKEFIRSNVPGRSNADLTELFNRKFELNVRMAQLKAFKKNNKISSGLTGKFEHGHIPVNKGKKGISRGGVATHFKKGHKPYNYVPVGSERVNGDDYVDIKIADPNKWKGKHILEWESHNGPVPKGYAVIFGDKNRRNFDQENLILVSRKLLATLNRKRLIQHNADFTRTGIIVANIYQKIGDRKRAKNKSCT
jgi:hypothetical protein